MRCCVSYSLLDGSREKLGLFLGTNGNTGIGPIISPFPQDFRRVFTAAIMSNTMY